ncbi:hypothetical protein [Desulfosarcina ovata]|nr:hypothetical protein [Desulfosarcina ovata]
MGRGKKAEPKSEIAGRRFERAKEIFGAWSSLLDDPRWRRIVFVKSEKSLRQWINAGVPNSRIPDLAKFFGVDAWHFTDPNIDPLAFDQMIYAALDRRENRHRPKELNRTVQKQEITVATKIRTLAVDWFEGQFTYKMIESVNRRVDLDLDDTEPFENEKDHRVLTFLAVCAFHFGKNWKYWFERVRDDARATGILLSIIKSLTHVRPRLRMLYAFQFLPRDRLLEYGKACQGSELSEIFTNEVLEGKMVAFIRSYEATMPQKVGTVLRELVRYWGE